MAMPIFMFIKWQTSFQCPSATPENLDTSEPQMLQVHISTVET